MANLQHWCLISNITTCEQNEKKSDNQFSLGIL